MSNRFPFSTVKLSLFIICFCLSSNFAIAQSGDPQVRLDSITNTIKDDTAQVGAALQLVAQLEANDYESAKFFAQWALDKSKQENYDWGVLQSYYWLANLEYEIRNTAVMHLYLDSIMALTDYEGFERILGRAYNQRGIAYYAEDDYINALRNWELALKSTPRDASSGILSNIGNINLSNDKLDEAIEYYLKAVAINKEQENNRFLVINYINIANCYPENDTTKIHYLNLGVKTARIADYTRILPYFFFDMSTYYSANHDFFNANRFIDSIRVREAEDEWLSEYSMEASSNYYYHMAIYKKNGQSVDPSVPFANLDVPGLFKKARDNFQKVLKETTTHRAMVVLYEYLAEIDTHLGDFESATKNYKQAYRYKDSLAQNQALFQLKQLEMEQEEAEKREAELLANQERQKQRNRLTLALGGAGMVLILAIGLFGRLRFVNRTRMIIQKEKDRSDELLHNILPVEVAAELKEKGESEAKDFDQVTVLFTDFVGFTKTAAKLSAKELVTEVNTCFKAFDLIIEKYKIEKIKTIGDAYMAAGGLHIPRTSEPADVINAGLEMQQFIIHRKEERSAQNLPAFDMRLGIHSGPVVAGIVGVKKFQYDIWGDTVNTASRMESNGAIGKVNISQATFDLVKDTSNFTFDNRGKIEVKGKGEMEMYFVEKK